MEGNKERGQLYTVMGLAVIVLAISVWAFVMNLHTQAQGGIVDQSPSSGQDGTRETKKADAALDLEKLAEAVLAEVSFDTELTRMEDSVVGSMITTASEDTGVILYMGEGTCADELLIVTVSDSDQLDAEIESVQKHLNDMQQSFQDYLPKEAKKINDAVILQSRNYIVACVSGDQETARSVLEEQLK